jgi:hypothetical protein
MPAQRQQIDVPLSAGLNQKDDPKEIQSSGALVMQNCVMLKRGAVTKRFGHTSLPIPSGVVSTVTAAGAFQGAPWLTYTTATGPVMATYSDESQSWATVDRVPDAVLLDRIGMGTTGPAPYDMDVAYSSGFIYVAFTADPNTTSVRKLYYAVLDAATHAYVVPVQPVNVAFSVAMLAPKLIVVGATVILSAMQAGGSSTLNFLSIPGASPLNGWTLQVPTITANSASFNAGVYDISAVDNDTTRFVVATESATGGITFYVRSASAFTAIATPTLDTGATLFTQVALHCTSGANFWAAYNGTVSASPVTRACGLDDSASYTAIAPVTVYTWTLTTGVTQGRVEVNLLSPSNATDCGVLFSPTTATGNDGLNMQSAFIGGHIVRNVSETATLVGQARTSFGLQLWSRTFFAAPGPGGTTNYTTPYVAAYLPSSAQGTVYLCAVDWWTDTASDNPLPLRWVATLDPRLTKLVSSGGPSLATSQSLCNPHPVNVAVQSGAVWLIPSLANTSVTNASIYLHQAQFAPTDIHSRGDLYNMQAIAGGVPSSTDGGEVTELGYAHYAQCSTTSVIAGGSLGVGAYSYIFVYEWYDELGNIHRSATSPAVTVTTTSGNNQVQLTVSQLALTARRTMVSSLGLPVKALPLLVTYRTLVGGSVYYWIQRDAVTGSGVSSLLITDSASDASISSNRLLYTTGGQLDNYCPPSGRVLISHMNRWWVAGCPDPTALWPSKEITPGEAPGFNEAQNVTCTGAIRALASLDDKLIIFVQRGTVYGLEYMTGQGPTDAGTLSDWTPPQPIPSDVGAVDQRSVCVGPFGVLFRATVGGPNGSGGIFLLSRDLQVKYLSSNVEDLLNAYPFVTAMHVHPNAGRVYIALVANDYAPTSAGIRLVWDYVQGGVWSEDTVQGPDGGQTATTGARCAFVANTAAAGNAYHYVLASGRVMRETNGVGANSYKDGSFWVPMKYQSADLAPSKSGFARFWRVWLASQANDPADMTIVLTYDGAPATYYNEPWTWHASAVASFDRYPAADVFLTPHNQKSRSITLTFTDATPTGASATTGQGYTLNALALDIGVKEGGYQNLPPAQRG